MERDDAATGARDPADGDRTRSTWRRPVVGILCVLAVSAAAIGVLVTRGEPPDRSPGGASIGLDEEAGRPQTIRIDPWSAARVARLEVAGRTLAPGSTLRFPPSEMITPILGIGRGGELAAVGFADGSGRAVMGPASTALALLMNTPRFEVFDASMLPAFVAALSTLAEYEELVDAVSIAERLDGTAIEVALSNLVRRIVDSELPTRRGRSAVLGPTPRPVLCEQADVFRDPMESASEGQPLGTMMAVPPRFCLDAPHHDSASDSFRYEQWGLRPTFIIDTDLATLRAYVPGRTIGTDSIGDLAVEVLRWFKDSALAGIGASFECLETLLPWDDRDCDDILKAADREMVGELARLVAEPPITDSVTIPSVEGRTEFVIAGWGSQTRLGTLADRDTMVWNLLSASLSILDLARPALRLLFETVADSISGGPKGAAADGRISLSGDDLVDFWWRCYSPSAVLEKMARSSEVRTEAINFVLGQRTALDLAVKGDFDGMFRAFDMVGLYQTILDAADGATSSECLEDALVDHVWAAVSTVLTVELGKTAIPGVGWLKLTQASLDVSWTLAVAKAKVESLTDESQVPDCIAVGYLNSAPAGLVIAAFPGLARSCQGVPSGTDVVDGPGLPMIQDQSCDRPYPPVRDGCALVQRAAALAAATPWTGADGQPCPFDDIVRVYSPVISRKWTAEDWWRGCRYDVASYGLPDDSPETGVKLISATDEVVEWQGEAAFGPYVLIRRSRWIVEQGEWRLDGNRIVGERRS